MEETVKTFLVPIGWIGRRLPKFISAVNKTNAAKYGRLRRGHVLLAGIDVTPKDERVAEVRVHLRRSPPGLRIPSGLSVIKMPLYDFSDIGKVLKDLTVAAAKVA